MDYYTRYPRPILWLIPGGEVAMGGEEADASRRFETTVEPFYLSKFPVTNEQYEAFDPGHSRSSESPGDRDPVTLVSWEEAEAYCRWYAEVSRKPMRLPTEVEWEHACRAGASGRFFFEDPGEADEYLWDREGSGGRLGPLDDKRANPHGLHGVLGGVWEWTASADDPGLEIPAPTVPRVLRGGSFLTPRSDVSCSRRRAEPSHRRFPDAGFRIAKSLRG